MADTLSNKVLILDNATTCAMRLKMLANIHGADVSIVHWNDWLDSKDRQIARNPCLVVIEQTVPEFIIESLILALPHVPLFLLFSDDKKVIWNASRTVTPLPASLSNFEMMALLEPYWSQEACILLPAVFVLDDNSNTAQLVSRLLGAANTQCQVSAQLYGVSLAHIDLILVNISDDYEHSLQLERVKQANTKAGIILYGESKDLEGVEFWQQVLRMGIAHVLQIEHLPETLLPALHQVWRHALELRDETLVVHQLQKVTESLMEQSLMLQVLFASSIDGIVAFDIKGKIVKANDSFADLVGKELEYLPQQDLLCMLNGQSKQAVEKLMAQERLQQQQILELRLLHEHSVYIPVSAAINRIHFHGESLFVAILRNVTAQHMQQKLLLQRNTQLDYQAKESKKRETQTVEAMRVQHRARVALTEKLCVIMANEQECLPDRRLTLDNLTRLMRLESGQIHCQPTALPLWPQVEKEVAALSELAERRQIVFSLRAPLTLSDIQFDESHLQLVLFNVLKNAIVHNLNNGQVLVSAKQQEGRVLLKVEDQGMGILEFKQTSLFDLYQSNLNDTSSLKTGLPLVQGLMQLNAAEILCSNHLRDGEVVGACFTLSFAISGEDKKM